MKKLHRERLLKLADFLDTLKRKQFDYSDYVTEYDYKNKCGTVCCAIGWCPAVFPEDWRWRRGVFVNSVGTKNGSTRHDWFGLSLSEFEYLFCPGDSGLPSNATPKRVAKHIRKFVESKAVSE